MRIIAPLSHALFILLVLAQPGCEPSGTREPMPVPGNDPNAPLCVYYAPDKIDIMPLTGFKVSDGDETQLNVYVSLIDSVGSQIKFPAGFRFELFDEVKRSPEPKGKRVGIWPQEEGIADPNGPEIRWFDLADPAVNNRYWRDFLRAYQFILPFRPESDRSYILEATCLTYQNKRLTAELHLKRPE